MIYVLATVGHVDPNMTERFGVQVDSVYANPFRKKQKKMSAAEIKQHVIDRIDDLLKSEGHHGSDDAGGKADA